jgi:hypothetical protein
MRLRSAARIAPKGLIPNARDEFCDQGLETVVRKLEECCRRSGFDFMLCTIWTDAAGRQLVLSHASKVFGGPD